MDRPAIRSALEQLHAESFGWALGCCGQDPSVAEEVLQAAYLKVLEGRARYAGRSSFKTWFFAVIRNTAADARRRQARRRLVAWPKEAEPEAPVVPLDVALHRREREARFRDLLARLPDRQREVLYLVFYHEMSLREAAQVMGVSLGSARTHYARGKTRLRQWLEATGDEGTAGRSAQGALSRTQTGR